MQLLQTIAIPVGLDLVLPVPDDNLLAKTEQAEALRIPPLCPFISCASGGMPRAWIALDTTSRTCGKIEPDPGEPFYVVSVRGIGIPFRLSKTCPVLCEIFAIPVYGLKI